jgi:hypothetical protein
MPVARTIDLPPRHSRSTGSAKRSGTAIRALLLAAMAALVLALLGYAYSGTGTGYGYPDPTQQWTD